MRSSVAGFYVIILLVLIIIGVLMQFTSVWSTQQMRHKEMDYVRRFLQSTEVQTSNGVKFRWPNGTRDVSVQTVFLQANKKKREKIQSNIFQPNITRKLRNDFLQPQPEEKLKFKLYKNTYGRLGNAMFQIAASVSIAKRHGRLLRLDGIADSVLTNVFSATALNYTAEGAQKGTLEIFADDFLSDLQLPEQDVVICCYLESWRYFQNDQEILRKIFTFRGEVTREAQGVIPHVSGATYIGVHVRRNNLPQKQTVPLNFLKRAMNYYRSVYTKTVFMICSDSPEWCKDNLLDHSNVILSEGHPAEIDMAILSLTNATIITYGTYGWWSGWLANGPVIYWANSTSHKHFYPPHWIPM